MQLKQFGKMAAALGASVWFTPHTSACIVQRPPTEIEREIEIEDFGSDISSGRHNYRISVDVNVFTGLADTVTCQCGALLGASPSIGDLPSSVRINEMELAVYSLVNNEYEYEYE
ncbi:MAG: hypothetical protein KDA61_13965, partial [Planctomycetales bacterium]|nr:hypothetical protein [Planctomycetales bacterium]